MLRFRSASIETTLTRLKALFFQLTRLLTRFISFESEMSQI